MFVDRYLLARSWRVRFRLRLVLAHGIWELSLVLQSLLWSALCGFCPTHCIAMIVLGFVPLPMPSGLVTACWVGSSCKTPALKCPSVVMCTRWHLSSDEKCVERVVSLRTALFFAAPFGYAQVCTRPFRMCCFWLLGGPRPGKNNLWRNGRHELAGVW